MRFRWLLAAALSLPGVAFAQSAGRDVRVKILSASEGKPMPSIDVTLTGSKDVVPGARLQPADRLFELAGKTNADGTAIFHIPDPQMPLLWFSSGHVFLCGDPRNVATELVLNKGAVIVNSCVSWTKFNWLGIRAQAGELIIFAQPAAPKTY